MNTPVAAAHPNRGTRHRALLAIVLSLPPLHAQIAPATKTAPIPAPLEKPAETVLPSPFIVVGDDKGYQAFRAQTSISETNTLNTQNTSHL